jgi:hypothetical protein
MRRILSAVIILLVFGAPHLATAQTQQQVEKASYCLGTKQFLEPSGKTTRTLGAFLDEKSYPGQMVLYLADYSNKSRAKGVVYTLFLTHKDGQDIYNIQNNAGFRVTRRSGDDIAFTSAPLGGVWTQAHLMAGIREAGRKTAFEVPVTFGTKPEHVECQSYTDPE